MERPWLAERDLDLTQAGDLIAARWPELAGLPVSPLAAGWDNWVFRVGDEFVFRFPRREVAVGLLLTETRVLPVIAPAMTLPIPVPEYVALSGESADWPFVGYRLLPGRTADQLRLSADQRTGSAVPLALFLRALHGLPPSLTDVADAPTDSWNRLDLPHLTEKLSERLDHAVERGLLVDRAAVDAQFSAAPTSFELEQNVLVHGDLSSRNVLVDDHGQLTGVIDWGDCHRGDPAVDLSMAHAFLPRTAHAAFRDAYGAVSDERWELARLRALFWAVVVLVYGDDVKDPALVAEGTWALEAMLTES
jgi:aminoglycoside phosphotransferase (APT) family kinase protein